MSFQDDKSDLSHPSKWSEQRVYVFNKNLTFDPVLDNDQTRVAGIFSRRSGDAFAFQLFPDSKTTLAVNLQVEDLSPGFQNRILGEFETHWGLQISAYSQSDAQSLIFPKMGSEHALRLTWKCQLEESNDRSVVRLERLGRFIVHLEGTNETTHDLEATNPLGLAINLGDAFSILTSGHSYGHVLVFRLVNCSQSSIQLEFCHTHQGLDVYVRNKLPIEATFFLRPTHRKQSQFVGGNPSISRSLSEIACVIADPFPPRFFLDVASGIGSALDIPLSKTPKFGPPRSSFPLIVIGAGDRAIWPILGDVSQDILRRTIRSIVYFGTIANSAIEEVLSSQNIEVIGIVFDAQTGLRTALPALELHNDTVVDGVPFFKEHQGKLIAVLLLDDLLKRWDRIDDFLLQIKFRRISNISPAFAASWTEHMAARLPALPFCRDLAISMALSVGNRHRGRCMQDSGSDDLSYEPLTDKGLWLFSEQETAIGNRDRLLLEIGFRTTAEYLAVRAYTDLLDFTQRSFREDLAPVSPWPFTLNDEARAYVVAWQRGAAADRELFSIAAAPLARRIRATANDDQDVLTSIANEFLASYHARLSQDGKGNEGQAAINPLVLVLASGGDQEYDLGLDLAATYWSTYAASYSGNKPGAIVATLVRREEISEALRRQQALRVAIRMLGDANFDVQLLDLRTKRRSFGRLVGEKISSAALDILKGANADRVVVFSPLSLDFLPFETSILGLERPLVRFPVSSQLGGDLLLVNCAAISSVASEAEGSSVVLSSSRPVDEAERWAAQTASAIVEIVSFWGFAPKTVSGADAAPSILSKIEASELIFFVGHATSEGSGAIDLGHVQINFEQLQRLEWTGKIAFLIGCETSAIDRSDNDLAALLLERGAVAVLATTAEMAFEVAHVFVQTFLANATSGVPLDYAFFSARRESVIAEALFRKTRNWSTAVERASEIIHSSPSMMKFSDLLAQADLKWDEAYASAVFSLSLTMAGGAGVRLR